MEFTKVSSVYLFYLPPHNGLPGQWINIANITKVIHWPKSKKLIIKYVDGYTDTYDDSRAGELIQELQRLTENRMKLSNLPVPNGKGDR